MLNSKFRFKIKADEQRQIVIEGAGEYVIELTGRGAKAEILGAFEAAGEEVVEVSVTTVHRATDTEANTFLRAVVGGSARISLRGLINVEKQAQRTNAFLRENVLLISDSAKAEAVPDLEIKANEVKCSHAATVGKIDEEQLFYLLSRGLSRQKAEKIIVDGFLEAVRERILNENNK
jgi:Fe-S cluster assembly protein SufD